MILIGVLDGTVDMCVSIRPEQLEEVREMYPDHLLQEQIGQETVGWLFDGVAFTAPLEN